VSSEGSIPRAARVAFAVLAAWLAAYELHVTADPNWLPATVFGTAQVAVVLITALLCLWRAALRHDECKALTPLGARVVAVWDAFHAMTTDRPYRSANGTGEALRELRRCAGSQLDPEVVEAFASTVEDGSLKGHLPGDNEPSSAAERPPGALRIREAGRSG